MTQRIKHLVSVGDFDFEVYEPTEGQIAILAQQLRAASRRSPEPGQAIAAMATFMTVLGKLIVNDDDRDDLHDMLINAEVSFREVSEAILAKGNTVDGEVSVAAPTTVVRRPARRNRS